MLDFTCQICGERPDSKSTQCPNCGSKVSFEHGNTYTTRPLFPRNFWKFGAVVVAGVMALNIWFVSSSAAALGSLITGSVPGIGSLGLDSVDQDSLLDDGFETDQTEGTGDPGSSDGTDSSDDSSGNTANTYSLTQKQINSGYEEWESSGVAWRWATDAEEANLECTYGLCTHVKIIALRNCKSVLLNGSLSTSESYDDQSETLVGYANNDIDKAGLKAGKGSTVELGTDSSFDVDTWTYLTYISCSDEAIGHD